MVAYAEKNTVLSKQSAPTKNSLAPIEVPVPTTPICSACSWSNQASKIFRGACFAVSDSVNHSICIAGKEPLYCSLGLVIIYLKLSLVISVVVLGLDEPLL
jgi:hypothetical protein